MRLTLRTLLAYLDNTLEPADAEILRQKVSESGFATQLVQKIRQRLADPSLPAPPPEAIGPVHDANVIGEYLDSTLPNEQVAEIERACLELDANLAEAAACHQILTMVLGNKADVPPSLRERIYQLPDREVERIAASSDRFSSISMDDTPSQHRVGPGFPASLASQDDLPTIESADSPDQAGVKERGADAVQPVGINDSGVFDAPTRLRESSVVNPGEVGFHRPATAIAGSRPRSTKDSIYGGSIRPSRITPWLVSLAIAGVLLFAVAQIFRPLLSKNRIGDLADANIPTDVIVPPGESPPMIQLDRDGPDAIVSPGDLVPGNLVPGGQIPGGQEMAAGTSAELLPPPEPTLVEQDLEVMTVPQGDGTDVDLPSVDLPSADLPSEDLPSADLPAGESAIREIPAMGVNDSDRVAPPSESIDSTTGRDATPDSPPPVSEIAMEAFPAAKPTKVVDEARPADAKSDDVSVVASIDASESIVVALNAQGIWSRLGESGAITANTPIVCGPKFRGVMETEFSPRIELIGPAGVRWLAIDEESYGLEVEFGRLLITSKEPESTLSLKLGDHPMELFFADEETVVAASIKRFRSPGVDPLDSPDQVALTGILVVQGRIQVKHDGETSKLSTGQQWIKRGEIPATVSPLSSIPGWISPPPSDETSLDDSAREGLLQLVGAEESLERALHEATLFRRSEVAALAAQTMLSLGQGDVYFGGDGILSEPKQRQYWPGHFAALVAILDRGPESAELLLQSIRKMDAANAAMLYRLLVGYSEEQLVEGGDEELVRLLDSESMAVRVLALENLHQITGTTLYFRAETDNRVRRTPAIRKWIVRQQKGGIRWQAGKEQ